MTNFRKVYVGKGKNNENGLDLIKINLTISDLEKLIYEYNGKEYATLEVARMKDNDPFNRTHTVYGNLKVQEETPKMNKPAKKRAPRKPKTTAS